MIKKKEVGKQDGSVNITSNKYDITFSYSKSGWFSPYFAMIHDNNKTVNLMFFNFPKSHKYDRMVQFTGRIEVIIDELIDSTRPYDIALKIASNRELMGWTESFEVEDGFIGLAKVEICELIDGALESMPKYLEAVSQALSVNGYRQDILIALLISSATFQIENKKYLDSEDSAILRKLLFKQYSLDGSCRQFVSEYMSFLSKDQFEELIRTSWRDMELGGIDDAVLLSQLIITAMLGMSGKFLDYDETNRLRSVLDQLKLGQ